MKYFLLLLIVVSSRFLNAQCATTATFVVTPPTCSTCCNGSVTVTHSCAITYTWMPGALTGASLNGLCGGTTYTVYVGMASTVCCGATVGTTTVYVPAAPPTSITELKELKNIIVCPNPNSGNITISANKSINYSVQITINDINGKIIYDKNSILNDDNNPTVYLVAKDGVYFVTITDKETQQRVVKKIVVEN